MDKYPKPYYRTQRGTWSVQVNGRQITLGKDKKAAFAEYHRLMAEGGTPVSPSKVQACELIDLFLDHAQRHKKASTYGWYKIHLQSFTDHAGRVPVAAIKPLHVTTWLDSHAAWGPSTRRGAITAVKRCWAWALEEGRIEANPLVSIKRPAMGRRVGMSDEGAGKIIGAIKSDALRDFVDGMIDTGCRPGELSTIAAADIAADGKSVIVKNKLGQRLVTLTDRASLLLARLAAKHPDGPIFLNTQGKPWNRNSLRCSFMRLRKETNVKGAVPYSLRHLFASRAIERGVDSLLVAELMGHKDVKMLQEHYAHYRAETLRKAAERATKSEGGAKSVPNRPPES